MPAQLPAAGDTFELKVTPPEGITAEYAEVSGDHNPIHLDDEFAKSVGLPGIIIHGLYTMAQVARAQQQVAGDDPLALKKLSVTFRGMAVPGEEITITGEVDESDDGVIRTTTGAMQGSTRLVRGATAELVVDTSQE